MSIFQELLACPRCDAKPLIFTEKAYTCKSCKNTYPLLEGIPFLFAEPAFSLGEWRERLNHQLVQFKSDADAINRELKQTKLLAPTRQRLQRVSESYTDQVFRLQELLSSLDVEGMQANFETYMALKTRLPQSQGLTTYYANMHRDWCWGEKENELSAQQVIKAIGSGAAGRTLVLGAGACRLAYDVHQQGKTDLTVALDINPLLLLSAKKIMNGTPVELYEFPIAPKTVDDQAILRHLTAPEVVNADFYFVLGDALHPPFPPTSFDTIITPWLLDIIPEDLRAFAPRINRLLKQGGKWINFGSLSFMHESLARCYGLDEIALISREAGFESFQAEETEMPYMQCPESRHGRIEQVITFQATKHKKAPRPKRYQSLPEWIVKGDTPVPQLQSFQMQAMATRIHAFIMALVDGRRSVKDMALMLEQQRLMPREEAEPAIQAFLTKMYEENLRNPNF